VSGVECQAYGFMLGVGCQAMAQALSLQATGSSMMIPGSNSFCCSTLTSLTPSMVVSVACRGQDARRLGTCTWFRHMYPQYQVVVILLHSVQCHVTVPADFTVLEPAQHSQL
jgi:hypothetical protein